MPTPQRLNKVLAEQLGISRREADDFIRAGRVRLNGAVAQLGARCTPGTDQVVVDNKPLQKAPTQYQYVLFNKPIGYVCSRRKQGETQTVYSLLPAELQQLKTVGRLDKDSSGLLLLTNDGTFAHRMTHPSFQKSKIYYVTLDRPLEPAHSRAIDKYGVQLEDGSSRLKLSSLHDAPEQKAYPEHTYKVTMSEGRNRQIRRTFAALGYNVERLHRTQFGPYQLAELKAGGWRVFRPELSASS